MEIPYSGRAIIDEGFDGMEITIPARKNWFVAIFLGVWLCMWLGGESFAIGELIGSGSTGAPPLFLLVWVVLWTVGGFFAFRVFWWMMAGKEAISVRQGVLTIDKRGLLFYKAKSYDLNEAANFRAQEEPTLNSPFGNMGMNNIFTMQNTGTIRFDYGMQTVKFAGAIDEAEANFIIQKLRVKKMIKG